MAITPLPASLSQTSGPFRALCILLVLAFVLGGGARGDIQSLMVLRPAAIMLLFYGVSRLQVAHLRENRFLFAMALAVLGLLILHLLPLPPALWSRLPQRELVVAIDRAADLGELWRPLSLAPGATLNAFYAAMAPLAALVLGVQLDPRERGWLLLPIIGLGGLSALLALAQMAGGAENFLRFYRVTNENAALGLFANRNHQALLLAALLPMIAVYASARARGRERRGARMLPAILAGAALIPLVLVTGSRAGLILAAMALLLIPAVLVAGGGEGAGNGLPDRRRELPRSMIIVTVVSGLVVLTLALGRGIAFERLLETSPESDMRFLIMPTLTAMIAAYLPLGSGLGSFAPVYQLHEPDTLLDPSFTNHAHNDWLELALTGGIPAIALLLAGMLAYSLRVRWLFSRRAQPSPQLRMARLGAAPGLSSRQWAPLGRADPHPRPGRA